MPPLDLAASQGGSVAALSVEDAIKDGTSAQRTIPTNDEGRSPPKGDYADNASYVLEAPAKSRRRQYQNKYRASPRGKAKLKAGEARYMASPKGKATRAQYLASPDGKAAVARYRASPKGKAAQKAAQARRREVRQATLDAARAFGIPVNVIAEDRHTVSTDGPDQKSLSKNSEKQTLHNLKAAATQAE